MRRSTLSLLMVCSLIISLSSYAFGAVPWTNITYTGYAYAFDGGIFTEENTLSSSSLPLEVSAYSEYPDYVYSPAYGYGLAELADNSMHVRASAYADCCTGRGMAEASLNGSFTALDYWLYISFNYTYDPSNINLENSRGWIEVKDLTRNTLLYSDYDYGYNNGFVYQYRGVPITRGNRINVYMGISTATSDPYFRCRYCGEADSELTLTYSLNTYVPPPPPPPPPPVVPEPVSSILFITGGATLGFRRFRKRITN